jgi:hypothetical protein
MTGTHLPLKKSTGFIINILGGKHIFYVPTPKEYSDLMTHISPNLEN